MIRSDVSKLKSSFGISIIHDRKGNSASHGDLRLPGILLAGVQKSGSTALVYFLERAGICLSFQPELKDKHKKEIHYFGSTKSKEENGISAYSELFAHCKDMSLAADGTPDNFLLPREIRETYDFAGKEALEKLKIVITVREPVARDLSRYNHRVNKCMVEKACSKILVEQDEMGMMKLSTPFSEYADNIVNSRDWERRTHHGLYGDIFEQWFKYFDRKQILVLHYDEMKQDEPSFLQRVLSFLELEVNSTLIERGTKQRNTKSGPFKLQFPTCSAQEQLSNAYSQSNEKFFKMIDRGDGPPMEQRPFPRFELSNCTSEEQDSNRNSPDAGDNKAIIPPSQTAYRHPRVACFVDTNDEDISSPCQSFGETKQLNTDYANWPLSIPLDSADSKGGSGYLIRLPKMINARYLILTSECLRLHRHVMTFILYHFDLDPLRMSQYRASTTCIHPDIKSNSLQKGTSVLFGHLHNY